MDSDDENNNTHLTEEILSTWKKSDLVKWLVDRKKKKSGNKCVLVKRILRTVNFEETSDSEFESSDESQVPNIDSLKTKWKFLTTSDCPPIRSEDVENYFVYNKNPLTGKKQGCHRQLKKARRFAKEQYLFNIECNDMNDSSYCCIRAMCKPSMRQTVSVGEGKVAHNYSVSVILVKRTGKIEEGRCNCKAGKSGLCSHVGGLLFTIVDVKNACTSKPCEWMKPTTSNKLTPQRLESIQFSLNENAPYKPYPDTAYRAGPCRDPDIFFKEIMQTLGNVAPQSVLYQTLNPEICDLKLLMTKYSPSFCFHDSIDISSSVCQSEFRDFTNSIYLSYTDIVQIQESTRGQSSNPVWKEMRTNILTASNFGAVCKKRENTEPDNLIAKLRGYSTPIDTKAMTYGRKKEGTARRDYMKNHVRQCGKVSVETTGLVISKTFPFLGASADGIVKCDKCGTGVLEIKCPFICRNEKPEHYATTKTTCVDLDENGHMKLKMQHNYMYQVQGQMKVLNVDWCDFVVWTKKGYHVERITYDSKFWEECMITQLKDFYSSCFLAERFTERVQRGKKLYR